MVKLKVMVILNKNPKLKISYTHENILIGLDWLLFSSRRDSVKVTDQVCTESQQLIIIVLNNIEVPVSKSYLNEIADLLPGMLLK